MAAGAPCLRPFCFKWPGPTYIVHGEYAVKTSFETQAIQIAGAPAIPGLIFRHFAGPELDFPQMVALINACNQADRLEEVASLDELRNNYTHLKNCDLSQDVLVVEIEGQMVGYTRVWWVQEPDGQLIYFHLGNLHPDWRRKGLGSAMLAWNQARLRELAAGHDATRPKAFRSFVDEYQDGARALLTVAGYAPERFFFEMKRDLAHPIPELSLPEGLEIRPIKEAQFRQVWETKEEIFRDHWGYSEGTEADYQRWLGSPYFAPELWKVAWEGDQIAGMILNFIPHEENEALDRKWGWTDPIGVSRTWRRRGLASALIAESMRELKARGMEYAALGVDVGNPLGALKLYERAGYETCARFEIWQKSLA